MGGASAEIVTQERQSTRGRNWKTPWLRVGRERMPMPPCTSVSAPLVLLRAWQVPSTLDGAGDRIEIVHHRRQLVGPLERVSQLRR